VELLIIIFLIILNGLFAMAEIAIVSSRKSKLQQKAEQGDIRAKKALELANNPNRFLSTIQIGITFVGIFAGAFGSETLANSLAQSIRHVPFIGPYSEGIALFLVVLLITYLSLVIGELVPKRIALSNPEGVASFVSWPTQIISMVTKPLVDILSGSTEWLLRLIGLKESSEIPVTEDEVKMLIREGARIGIFNLAERDIVERTFRLADQRVVTLMTPRNDMVWIDIDGTPEQLQKKLAKSTFSYLPVSHKRLDTVVGVVRTKELLRHYLDAGTFDLKALMHKPIFVPENLNALKVLETFKKAGIHVAVVVNEYGHISGLLSITDILEAIVGDIPTLDEIEEKAIIERKDGSFLVDGLTLVDEFKEFFKIQKLPNEKSGQFHTIGGFIMHSLNKVPSAGDTLDSDGLQFEVVDMDGNRVDKLLVKRI
jgi:putative hemolysin